MRPMTYRIGDVLPLEGTGIWGGPLRDDAGAETVAWFIFRTPPMKEIAAEAWLTRQGVIEAWHPVITDWVPAKGANPRRRKIPITRRVAPGYVFACVDREIRWHVLFEAARGRVAKVVTLGGLPLAIPDAVIAQMQHVPRRVEALHKHAEEARLAEMLAKQPKPGETARVMAGALAGMVVEVESIHGGLAQCLAWGFRKIAIDAKTLERKA